MEQGMPKITIRKVQKVHYNIGVIDVETGNMTIDLTNEYIGDSRDKPIELDPIIIDLTIDELEDLTNDRELVVSDDDTIDFNDITTAWVTRILEDPMDDEWIDVLH